MSNWVEMMRVLQQTCYVSGVPEQRDLLCVQEAQVIAALGGRTCGAQYLDRDAALAWVRMRHAAAVDRIELWIVSGYRSNVEQARLYAEWERGERTLRPARPGWSLHESGRAADVLRSHDDPDGGGPRRGETDLWLADHAHEFGFAQTVALELWHWQFMGDK